MVEIDHNYGGNLSWTGYRWDAKNSTEDNEIGPFTARIPVLNGGGGEVFSIYVMDSQGWSECNGRGFYKNLVGNSCISPQAVNWYAE